MSKLITAMTEIKNQNQEDISSMRLFIKTKFPVIIQALQIIDNDIGRRKRRHGLNLVPRESKKHGVIWYARFSYKGKMLPTKFNTYLSDEAQAEIFAKENKNRLIEQYLARKDGRMYKMIEGFYDDKTDNPDVLRLSDRNRKEYKAVIINKFIPFLKSENILSFDQIKIKTLTDFQDKLLSGEVKLLKENNRENLVKKAIKPQSVNNDMKSVRKLFAYLARKETLAENIAERVKGLPILQQDRKARGCYELERLNGIFNKRWKNEISLLLCMLIYTTGMRNSEIKRIRLDDIKSFDGCRFINVKKSKTDSGVRLVPLHNVLYRKLKAWAIKNNKKSALFDFVNALHFKKANNDLAKMLKVSDDELEADNITFYSGRHFWKTLMSAEGLGEDIEEIFMGHKVVSNVAKLYNHRDKFGKERLAKKAKQVFKILDRCIYNRQAFPQPKRGHKSLPKCCVKAVTESQKAG